jgi:glucose/mannose transport system substrate-binding protein
MKAIIGILTASTLALSVASQAIAGGKVEGIHQWTADSEVKALKVLTNKLSTLGYTWVDSAVGGNNGANANQALRTRIAAGNPPATMQLLGQEGIGWAKEDALRSLNALYAKNGWAPALPPAMTPFLKNGDDFFAVPVNMHRQNWVWANKAIFDKYGVSEPKSWSELIASAKKLKAAGVTPIALSDESWQIMQIFEAILVDENGPDFFRKAVTDHDKAALTGPEIIKAFDELREIRGLVDDGITGRDWSVATTMVASGKAAMQIMGDWAKGEFLTKGLKPGVDFLCFPTPTDKPNYKFVSDTFGMFKTNNAEVMAGQDAWAQTIMDPQVQKDFNLIKGSIPARLDVSMEAFDDCAKRSFADRQAAIKSNAMLGTLTDNLATPPQYASVFLDVVGQFFVSNMTSADAAKQLVKGISNAD